ncbi:MAG TPA: helix-turn-helix transcriptional regulator [Thermoanaerobaculia bacterium]|jgi:transcriptional regulator with XRE-family HTH domain|nr:helix-turn-helix transcriptional regulator [Thermoanaerobaculia bacterium]
MQKSPHAFGAALRLLRTRRRLKQWEVAEKAGMTKAMLSSYETGKVTPTLQSLITIFEALETDFFGFQDALEAAGHADRLLLEVERPSPRKVAAAEGDRQARPNDQGDGSPPPEFLGLRLEGIESQLERIATCIEILARRTLGEAGRAVPQGSDQR